MDSKVAKTSSALSTEATLKDAEIVVGDPSKWLALLVPGEMRICNYFDDCMVSFYECLFTIVELLFPFS